MKNELNSAEFEREGAQIQYKASLTNLKSGLERGKNDWVLFEWSEVYHEL